MRSVFSPLLLVALSTFVCLAQAAPSGSSGSTAKITCDVWECPKLTPDGNYTLSHKSSTNATLACSYKDVRINTTAIHCYYNETNGSLEGKSAKECAPSALCANSSKSSSSRAVARDSVSVPSSCTNFTCPKTAGDCAYNLTLERYGTEELRCRYKNISNDTMFGCGYNLGSGNLTVGGVLCPHDADPCPAAVNKARRSLDILARNTVVANCTVWACPPETEYGNYVLSSNATGATLVTCGYKNASNASHVSCIYDKYTKKITGGSSKDCYPTEICAY